MASEVQSTSMTRVLRPELEPVNTSKLQETCNVKRAAEKMYKLKNLECWSERNKQIMQGDRYSKNEHGFVSAVRVAYNHHIPLSISADHIWNLIIQGISEHISKNSEALRSKFVNFNGQQKLVVRRDNFVKGSQDNDWAGCFDEWVEQIEGFVGSEKREIFCPEFSTTGFLQKACTNLGFMDAMKSYFKYHCRTKCGIKAVRLEGTEEDWIQLEQNVQRLRELDIGLEWWIDVLEPIVAIFVATYRNEEIPKWFWESIYKHYSPGGSGTVDSVDGWITHFFPYVCGQKATFESLQTLYERCETPLQLNCFRNGPGIEEGDVPNGIAKTPFVWEYLGENLKMTFYNGFIGCEIDEENFVQPVQFWAVGPEEEKESNQNENLMFLSQF